MNKFTLDRPVSVWLDVIRALSAQAVVVGHIHQIFFSGMPSGPDWSLQRLARSFVDGIGSISHQAVVAFFVMSGYLIGGRILHEVRNDAFLPGEYIVDRLTRLWVVLLPALVLTATLDWISFNLGAGAHIMTSRAPFYPAWWETTGPWSIATALSNASFMQMIVGFQFGTNLSLWSISNEFWYYVLFPAITLSIVSKGRMRVAAAFVTACILVMFAMSGTAHFEARSESLFFYLLIWVTGAFAPFITGSGRRIVGSVALLYAVAAAWHNHFMIDPTFFGDVAVMALTLGFLLHCHAFPVRLLAKPAKFFAGYSYSLYAIHLPIVFLLMSFDPLLNDKLAHGFHSYLWFGAYVATANIAAVAFWLATERNTAKIRWRLTGLRRKFNKTQLCDEDILRDEAQADPGGLTQVSTDGGRQLRPTI
jgi:peptidoglycan/LPS O-acetylase OafA/YrhL